MKTIYQIGFILTSIILLSGCTVPPLGNPTVHTLSDVKPDEVILVGKVKLTPPLKESEQDLNVPGMAFSSTTPDEFYKNKFYFAVKDKMIDMRKLDGAFWSDGFGRVELEKTFFIKTKKARTLYYSGGVLYLSWQAKKYFPGGLKYLLQPGDKAVYIGTIEYHRDEFNGIDDVKLLNEYGEAKKQFSKKFGRKIPLRKAKVKLIK